jgi:glycosyltransferase involved in cell wall biosynthesis
MRVGVIVPVHGWAPYLAEAIDSVLAEDPDEVVVVDDGSRDPLALHPDHAERCTLVRREARGGPAVARATGLRRLEAAEAIALCDADDAWRPGFLAAAFAALTTAPPTPSGSGPPDVAVGTPTIVGPGGRPTGERWQPRPPGPFVPSFTSNEIATPAVVVRRDALERAGGFVGDAAAPGAGAVPPPLHHAEDWDLWLRLRSTGARFVSVPSARVAVRRRAGALTSDVAALARAQLAVHARHAALASEEERERARADDLRALAAGLTRERRFAEARGALGEAGRDPLRRALLAVPLARRALGRRDPYRR